MFGLRSAVADGVVSPGNGVDISGVYFVTPGGLVGLACLIETWASQQGAVTLKLPGRDVTSYLHRMDFFERLRGKIAFDERGISHLKDRGRHGALLSELRTVHELRDAREVAKHFCDRLLGRGLPEDKVRQCYAVVSETLTNAVDHADSLCGAYTIIQSWEKREEVAVAVADAGLSIPRTIAANPRAHRLNLQDHDLVKLATKHTVSSIYGETGRGGGFTSALRGVSDGSGQLTIWSRRGWVKLLGLDDIAGAKRVCPFPGTCVEAVFPLSEHSA